MTEYTSIQSTTLYLGTCATCNRPYRVDLGNKYAALTVYTNCPGCTEVVEFQRLVAVTTEEVCDPRCMGATGPSCSCGCGGANHGAAWGTSATTYELESAVAALQARQERTVRQRKARQEAKQLRKQRTFDTWAENNHDIIAYLNNEVATSNFVIDMQHHIINLEPLSERQAEVVRDIMHRAAEREVKQAAYEASKKPAPLGKGIVIEGTIISVKPQETHYTHSGEVTMKMTVECDGYRVWGSVPRSLLGYAIIADDYANLKSKRVRFTAELSASKNGDQSFAIYKRPTNAELIS